MFDLFRRRDKAVRVLLGGLLVIVAASMLLYLIPGSTPNVGASGDQVLVEFGKDSTLTANEVDRYIQNSVRGQRLTSDLIPIMLPQMLDQMIHERAVAYEAQRIGMDVSDAELANTIQSIGNGQFNDRSYYERFVNEQGMTIPQFESELRREQLVLKMRNIVAEGIVVTPDQVKRAYAEQNEKAKVQFIAYDPNQLKATIKPSASDLQTFFSQNSGMFMVPERRNVDLIVIDDAKVADTIDVSDAQQHSWYNSHLDQYRLPERVKARHILFKTTGKSPAEVAQIKQKAEDVLKQVRGGADFAALAKKYSDDKNADGSGSANQGGELGWFGRGQMVANFEKATFALKPGQISDLIPTEYGFHIIQVEAHEQPRVRPFDEVKGEIATEMKKQSVVDKMQQIADTAAAQLAKAPQNAQQIANQFHVAFTHVDNLAPSQPIPGIGSDAGLSSTIASLKKNEVSPPVQVGATKLVIAVLRDIVPTRPAAFADVEQQVRDQYVQRQASEVASQKAKQAAALLKSNGGDMEAAARATGGTVKTSEEFARNGAITGVGPAALFAPAFSRPVGTIIGPVASGPALFVAKVVQVIPPDMRAFEAQRASLIDQLKSNQAQQRYGLFEDSVLVHLVEQGKVRIHRDAMDRLAARYRG